jgi:hypothetical protein
MNWLSFNVTIRRQQCSLLCLAFLISTVRFSCLSAGWLALDKLLQGTLAWDLVFKISDFIFNFCQLIAFLCIPRIFSLCTFSFLILSAYIKFHSLATHTVSLPRLFVYALYQRLVNITGSSVFLVKIKIHSKYRSVCTIHIFLVHVQLHSVYSKFTLNFIPCI